MGRLMSINGAAQYLGVCPDTVRRHIRLGLLQARQKPRGTKYQWLVDVPDTAPADGVSPSASREVPGIEEYDHLLQMVSELRRMLDVATAELEARRQETARLLALLERAQPAANVP